MPLFQQDLSSLKVIFTPIALTESVNDLELPAQVCNVTSDGAYNITGLAIENQQDGWIVRVINDSEFNITLVHDSASSAEANRIWRATAANYTLLANGGIAQMFYREVVGRTGWWLIG